MQLRRQFLFTISVALLSTFFLYFLYLNPTRNFKVLQGLYQKSASTSEEIQPGQPEQGDWQEVAGLESKYHFNVYSAYHILGRNPAEVLVIGTARTFTKQSVSCRIYFKDPDQDEQMTIEIKGFIETMVENWKLTYAGVFIHCPFSKNTKLDMVSILLEGQMEPSNMVPIQHKSEVKPVGAHQYNISLCVHPVYKYNEVFHLVEWIEFYKMMGVEQITLYNVSIGPDASCILRDLMDGSDPLIKMNVHPWHKHPIKNSSLIRGRCAQCAYSAGDNDCLYRHRGRVSKYMVFVDLDEYILPRENIAENYPNLINFLDSQRPGRNIGEYMFKNGFFIRSHPDDPLLASRCSKFQSDPFKSRVCRESFMMSKVLREDYHPYRIRTKYIIKPEGVKQAGTHVVYNMESGYESFKVPPHFAFSRHYRYFEPEGSHTKIDRAPEEFAHELVNNLANKMEYFIKKCKLKF